MTTRPLKLRSRTQVEYRKANATGDKSKVSPALYPIFCIYEAHKGNTRRHSFCPGQDDAFI